MTLNNFLKQIIFPALLAFEIYTYNCYIGKRGLYLFDFSTVYNMGWLLFKGWIPFVDFKMPLMPLSGALTALSFYFFSVKYYSAVKFAGIICALSSIYMGYKLQKYLGVFFGYAAASLVILSTIPIHGTFYYNHLSMLLISIYLILVIDFMMSYKNFLGKKERISSSIIYFFITLIAFNKLHVGILTFLFFTTIEVRLFLKEKCKLRDALTGLITRLLPPIIILFALLIWVNFNILDLIDNLLHSTKSSSYFDVNSVMRRIGISDQDTVFSSAGINIYLVALFSIGLIFYHFRFNKNNALASRLIYFIGVAPLIQFLSFAPSAEAPTIDISFIMVYVTAVCIYFLKTASDSDIKKSRFICAIFATAFFISCATFVIHYSKDSLRKSWDENKSAFLAQNYLSKNKYSSDNDFFSDIKITHSQKKNFDYLNKILSKYDSKKVFFGPELEMFYPATKRLPPKNWPLWMHRDVSYNSDNLDQMKKIFIDQNYDLVVLSRGRYGFTDFVNSYISKNYNEIKQADPEIWIQIFVKK